ncbi:MAG: carbohydrate ABC transporter permease [Treponema sp.]|jgi:multiple sugar transport system permease protein|nr:carbohydrate ABC transporter permease [Treponema sp.]
MTRNPADKKNPLLIVIFLVILGAIILFPLIITIAGSFMTEQSVYLNYSSNVTTFDLVDGITQKFKKLVLIPNPVTLGQYANVLINQPSFLVLIFNSLKIALPVTIGALLSGLLTAYGFTIWKYKHKEKLFLVFIVVMLMPLQAVLVPNYIIASIFGIQRSYLAIILPGIFSPFSVFLSRQSMKVIPEAYFESAKIDGAGNLYIFIYILIPQLKSTIAAICMLTFIEYWNVVEQAIIFIDNFRLEPLSVYLSRLADGRTALIFAASCIYMFLPIWFLLSGQRDLEKGIELSGVK